MKTVAASDFEGLESLLGSAQKERIVLTRNGKPAALLVGIESYDAEDLQLASSKNFWQLIESRRKGPSIPLADLKKRLKTKAVRGSSTKALKKPKVT